MSTYARVWMACTTFCVPSRWSLGSRRRRRQRSGDSRRSTCCTRTEAAASSSTVSVGDEVAEGALLGAVSDVYGQVIEEFRSPTTGFVLRLMLWGTVATGAEVFWVAA